MLQTGRGTTPIVDLIRLALAGLGAICNLAESRFLVRMDLISCRPYSLNYVKPVFLYEAVDEVGIEPTDIGY